MAGVDIVTNRGKRRKEGSGITRLNNGCRRKIRGGRIEGVTERERGFHVLVCPLSDSISFLSPLCVIFIFCFGLLLIV